MAERPHPPVGGPTPGRTGLEVGIADRGEGAAPTGGEDDDLLAQVLAQVEAALTHARSGEWEQAGACDSRCRALVESLTNHPDPEALAEGLIHVRAQYRELLALAEAERDKLADSVRQSVRGKAGAMAYEENR